MKIAPDDHGEKISTRKSVNFNGCNKSTYPHNDGLRFLKWFFGIVLLSPRKELSHRILRVICLAITLGTLVMVTVNLMYVNDEVWAMKVIMLIWSSQVCSIYQTLYFSQNNATNYWEDFYSRIVYCKEQANVYTKSKKVILVVFVFSLVNCMSVVVLRYTPMLGSAHDLFVATIPVLGEIGVFGKIFFFLSMLVGSLCWILPYYFMVLPLQCLQHDVEDCLRQINFLKTIDPAKSPEGLEEWKESVRTLLRLQRRNTENIRYFNKTFRVLLVILTTSNVGLFLFLMFQIVFSEQGLLMSVMTATWAISAVLLFFIVSLPAVRLASTIAQIKKNASDLLPDLVSAPASAQQIAVLVFNQTQKGSSNVEIGELVDLDWALIVKFVSVASSAFVILYNFQAA